MSERAEIAQRIATFVVDNDICQVYGGDVHQEENKKGKPYSIGFSQRVSLDGQIWVYGPKFIQVGWQTRYGILPQRDAWVFTSESDALTFLKLAFVDFDPACANVPHKSQVASPAPS